MKKILFYILILFLLFGISIPAYGETPLPSSPLPCTGVDKDYRCLDSKSYVLLAPLPCAEKTPGCEEGVQKTFDPTQKENVLGAYLNTLLRIFIALCAILAMIMIVIGGLEYMTSELVSSKESGKHKITGAIFGLILALGAYALLNTINPDLLNTELKSLKDVTVVVDLNDRVPQPLVNGKYGIYMAGLNWATTAGSPTPLPSWVTVNSPECVRVGDRNCTSLRKLQLTYLEDIHAKCPSCSLMITGWTESWLHGGATGSTSHKPGSATIDLRANPELNKFLSGGRPLKEFERYPGPGGTYLYEGDHWHIGP